jgi:hypothetical protein
MLDKDKVLAKYRENYQMAIDDGHTEEASRIAWEWTWNDFENAFVAIKTQHDAELQENINKTFFG